MFAQVALRLAPKILNPVDVILPIGEQHGMIDPAMLEPRHIQRVLAIPAVRIDDAVRSNFLLYDRYQRCRCRVGNDLCIDLVATL